MADPAAQLVDQVIDEGNGVVVDADQAFDLDIGDRWRRQDVRQPSVELPAPVVHPTRIQVRVVCPVRRGAGCVYIRRRPKGNFGRRFQRGGHMDEYLASDDQTAIDALRTRPPDEIIRQMVKVDDPSDLALLREIALADGLQFEDTSGIEFVDPVSILVITGTVAMVGGTISWWLERRKGGQVIDLTQSDDSKRFRRTKGLQLGLVVVIAADGTVATVEVKEPRGFLGQVLKDVIDALGHLTDTSAEAVKGVLENVVRERGQVTVGIPAGARLD